MVVSIFFLYGLLIGSFLNVVVLRLQKEESLGGRSYCPSCKHQIRWYDNVPLLSFLILRGKCRDCKVKISIQYPLVELGTGIIFALTGYAFFNAQDWHTWMSTVFYLVLFCMLIVIGVYDFLTMYIPMLPVWLGMAWIVVYLVLLQWILKPVFFAPETFFDVLPFLLSACGAAAFFYALVFVSKETWMGMGDVYLAFLVGLVSGWPGTLLALTLSSGLGSVYGLTLVAKGEKGMKSQVPFGPFMVLGTIVWIVANRAFPFLGMWFVF